MNVLASGDRLGGEANDLTIAPHRFACCDRPHCQFVTGRDPLLGGDSSTTGVPGSSVARAITTLSSGCRRMTAGGAMALSLRSGRRSSVVSRARCSGLPELLGSVGTERRHAPCVLLCPGGRRRSGASASRKCLVPAGSLATIRYQYSKKGLLQGSFGMQKARPVYKGSGWHECRVIDILATELARSSTSVREDSGKDTPVVADCRRQKCHPRDRRCGYNEFDTIS